MNKENILGKLYDDVFIEIDDREKLQAFNENVFFYNQGRLNIIQLTYIFACISNGVSLDNKHVIHDLQVMSDSENNLYNLK